MSFPSTQEIGKLRLKHPRCRAKFSQADKDLLTAHHGTTVAAKVVSSLHKIHGSATTASNFSWLEVKNGKIRSPRYPVWQQVSFDTTSSINHTIAMAVAKGYIALSDLRNEGGPRLDKLTLGIEGVAEDAPKEPEPSVPSEPVPEPEPEPEPAPVDKYERLYRKLMELRRYVETEGNQDTISTGAVSMGFKMLKNGFSEEAILHALTINWPDTARATNRIEQYDPLSFGDTDNGYHRLSPYVTKLAETRIPILLVGPTQSGKSTLAKHVAEILELPFAYCPLTGGASPAWLLGRDTRDGYKLSEHFERYTKGGVFLYDEVDAADPNMFLVLNNALVSDHFDHPFVGRLDRHPDFIPIAAANTWGTGATAAYRGRAKMDGAVLERFRLGRVYVNYDEELERKILKKYQEDNG